MPAKVGSLSLGHSMSMLHSFDSSGQVSEANYWCVEEFLKPAELQRKSANVGKHRKCPSAPKTSRWGLVRIGFIETAVNPVRCWDSKSDRYIRCNLNVTIRWRPSIGCCIILVWTKVQTDSVRSVLHNHVDNLRLDATLHLSH